MNKPQQIPNAVQKSGLFCCWKYEQRTDHLAKIPYDPSTGHMARSNDPGTFCDFPKAVNAMTAHGYDGVGLGIFNGVCAIDLDDCFNPDHTLKDYAEEIVTTMHSYTEYSPSDTGLHIYFLAEDFPFDKERYYTMNHPKGVEVYVSGATSKFVTVTGNICRFYEFGKRAHELQIILDSYMLKPEKVSKNPNNPKIEFYEKMEDEKLLQLALRNTKFHSLWQGNTCGYSSMSEADMALCSMLAFWTGKNAEQMDRLFRRSGLMREKWDRQQSGSTYGAITTQKAIDGCQEVYSHVPVNATAHSEECSDMSAFLPIVPFDASSMKLPDFPMTTLPVTLRDYAQAVSDTTQTAPEMAAVIGIGVLAAALQGKFFVEVHSAFREPLNLYLMIVAAPGERKSGVMKLLTDPIRQYEQQYNLSHKDERTANRNKRNAITREIKSLEKKLEQKIDDETQLQLEDLERQLEETPEIHERQFIADNCTPEALTRMLAQNNGVLTLISAEGGIFDIMGGAYSSKPNIDVFLKAHCGDLIKTNRVNRDSECIERPCLTMILAVQPTVLNQMIGNPQWAGRGLPARFCYAIPKSMVGKRALCTFGIKADLQEFYEDFIFRLMDIPNPEKTTPLHFSPDAMRLLQEFYGNHEQYMVQDGSLYRDWTSKFVGMVIRIAGLLHIAGQHNEEDLISYDTLNNAITIGEYFKAHAEYAYISSGGNESIAKAKFVLAQFCKSELSEMKRAELFDRCKGRYFEKAADLEPTLDLLESHGYLRSWLPPHTGPGRKPVPRYALNPAFDRKHAYCC